MHVNFKPMGGDLVGGLPNPAASMLQAQIFGPKAKPFGTSIVWPITVPASQFLYASSDNNVVANPSVFYLSTGFKVQNHMRASLSMLAAGTLRAEGNAVSSLATGFGVEIGYSFGAATGFIQTYDRTNSVFGAFTFSGTSISFTQGPAIFEQTIRTGGYTVATLPTGVTGMRAYVTDALAPTYNAVLVGGGAIKVPAFYNGTAWVAA